MHNKTQSLVYKAKAIKLRIIAQIDPNPKPFRNP